jgi:hypothetical protein
MGLAINEQKARRRLWEQRGHSLGSPEFDWFAVERALISSLGHRECDQDDRSRLLEAFPQVSCDGYRLAPPVFEQ